MLESAQVALNLLLILSEYIRCTELLIFVLFIIPLIAGYVLRKEKNYSSFLKKKKNRGPATF